MNTNLLRISAPGRLCLFGEHQDYFGLSIIAGAINRRITITGAPRTDSRITIACPDIDERDEFDPRGELPYKKERDYLRSTVNVLRRTGLHFPSGWDIVIRGNIPINSGTASSSALVVAWVKFLLEAGGDARAADAAAVAELAFDSEVAEFGEPGGKMDHYASAVGGIVAIHFGKKMRLERLNNPLKTFVLADSMQRKNTTGTLAFIKGNVLSGIEGVRRRIPDFSVYTPLSDDVRSFIQKLPDDEHRLLLGTLKTRDLTAEGRELFNQDPFDHNLFGDLLNRQQDIIRDHLRISTPRIDTLLDTALDAGALGAKINGSGEGGCIFAYAPDKAEEAAEALNRLDARAHIVHIDEGVRKETA
ncbi:MAG: hypothetical protein MUP70_06505 [Candidatus Aminicenantes bacterium]|nr:hypothetical protein [Candidatus Aminicenantes bacterium]